MKKIVIVGAGGFGREVKFLIDRINDISLQFELVGFYDDNQDLSGIINGIPYLGTINDLLMVKEELHVALGIGVPQLKKMIIDRLNPNEHLRYPNIIDPSAIIGKDHVIIGRGNVFCAGVIATCNITIGDFITFNLCCSIGHDTNINNFASFMPNVNISGEVFIDNNVYVGTGAKIINQLTIGENTIIGAGAVVAKSLPANCTAVGIPAKPIKFNNA